MHKKYPGKLMAYNCSPSFNWRAKLDRRRRSTKFQRELGAMGYKFQFVTLAGFHALNLSMFDLADGYRDRGMAAYCELQDAEFAAEKRGYTATRHQREVGTGYFDSRGRDPVRRQVLDDRAARVDGSRAVPRQEGGGRIRRKRTPLERDEKRVARARRFRQMPFGRRNAL